MKNYFSISVLFHIILLTLLIASFDFSATMPVVQNSDKDMKILNAVVMDAPPGTLLPSPPPKKIAQTPPPPTPKPIPKPVEQKKVVDVPPPKPKPLVVPDQRQKQQALATKELLLDMKKQADEQKKLKHKEIQKAFEKELKAQAEKALQQQVAQEQNRLSSVQSQQARGEVNKYKALILQAISQHWLVPATINKKLTCELLIRVAPGGMVLDVQVAKSSGDLILDRSARAAVFKASPLPVPADSGAFEAFRQFVLKVRPENIA